MLKYMFVVNVMVLFMTTSAFVFDFDNIGDSIMRSMNQQMENMGMRVQKSQRQTNDMFSNIMESVMKPANDIQASMKNFHSKMNARMQDVQKHVSVIGIRGSMIRGAGGTAFITYGNNYNVMVTNERYSWCHGNFVMAPNGRLKCDGMVTPVQDMNPCIPGISKSRFNDVVCMGDNAMLSVVNNRAVCDNGILYRTSQLQSMCGAGFGTSNYAHVYYFPNMNNMNTIVFPNPNQYIGCLDPTQNFCEYYTDDSGLVNEG